jgi:hypothetical protein
MCLGVLMQAIREQLKRPVTNFNVPVDKEVDISGAGNLMYIDVPSVRLVAKIDTNEFDLHFGCR